MTEKQPEERSLEPQEADRSLRNDAEPEVEGHRMLKVADPEKAAGEVDVNRKAY